MDINATVKERLKAELLRRKTTTTTAPVVEEAVVLPTPAPVLVAPAGMRLASDVLGVAVPKNFSVTVLDVAAVPEQVRPFIPAVDTTYTVQAEEAIVLLRALEYGDKVLITGPTGSGKSSLVKHLCALTNRPMVRLNMSGDIESSHIFGQLEVADGSTVWKDGAATEAVRYGAVLVNDEWDVTPPEIMFGYQWLMEDDGKLFLKEKPGSSAEKMIVPHKEFRFVCLGNTLGQGDESGRYAGTNVQNSATLDRFQTTIKLGYLSSDHEVALLTKVLPALTSATAAKMVQFAALVRAGNNSGSLSSTVSPRTLLNWGRKSTQLGSMYDAVCVAYLNKLSDDDHKVAAALYSKVFG